MRDDLKSFFLGPKTSKQRQYEALRAYVIDEASASQVADRFGFTEKSLYGRIGLYQFLLHHIQRIVLQSILVGKIIVAAAGMA